MLYHIKKLLVGLRCGSEWWACKEQISKIGTGRGWRLHLNVNPFAVSKVNIEKFCDFIPMPASQVMRLIYDGDGGQGN